MGVGLVDVGVASLGVAEVVGVGPVDETEVERWGCFS